MIAAVVPVKRLSEAKSRLAERLGPGERASLAGALVQRTVRAIQESGVVDVVVVATPDKSLAAGLGAKWLADGGSLNATLQHAAQRALELHADGLLIVPADLALLTPDDIVAVVQNVESGPGIGIAATQDGGTGALFLRPPDVIPPAFGESSYQRHLDLAAERKVGIHRIARAGFAFDIDTVDDYDSFGARVMSPE